MHPRKSLALATATVALGAGVSLSAPTAQAHDAQQAPQRAAVADNTAASADAAQRPGWHTVWGNTWVKPNGKWTSNSYKAPTKGNRAVLRCYNTRAKNYVAIHKYVGGRWKVAGSSGWRTCNPNGGMTAKAQVTPGTWLRVRVGGKQGSFVRAEKWS
ncbi:hypothetical protein [Streptomyces sp. NPDC057302]|uniref:hypothetical protein n=1 Tax=Streptomyces sp. NPDC057302 TaxID=3346094 RepID=UPI0036377BB7